MWNFLQIFATCTRIGILFLVCMGTMAGFRSQRQYYLTKGTNTAGAAQILYSIVSAAMYALSAMFLAAVYVFPLPFAPLFAIVISVPMAVCIRKINNLCLNCHLIQLPPPIFAHL